MFSDYQRFLFKTNKCFEYKKLKESFENGYYGIDKKCCSIEFYKLGERSSFDMFEYFYSKFLESYKKLYLLDINDIKELDVGTVVNNIILGHGTILIENGMKKILFFNNNILVELNSNDFPFNMSTKIVHF